MSRETPERTNRFLTLLADQDYQRLRPRLSHVDLAYKDMLCETDRPIEFVYFPIDGVASLVNVMDDGSAAEVGTIGSEGLVGLPLIFGDETSKSVIYVQVPGTALKLDAHTFRAELERNTSLRIAALRYAHAFFNQVSQSAACAHLHALQQRCCRWLLMTRDRMPSDEFLLTQEFLGMMLGVQRNTVSVAMGRLQKLGAVRYSRGHVVILDRGLLLQHSCECYAKSKDEFDQLLGDTPRAPRTDRFDRLVGRVG
jgi:CRP-like cAMP-binding protein